MDSLLTIEFSGTSSKLESNFFPEIFLDADCNYSCALLDLIIIPDGKETNKDATKNEEVNKEPIKEASKEAIKKIKNLGLLVIECDIVSDYYINGNRSHTIHQFATSTSYVKDQSFVEIPKHINYLRIKKTKHLRSIQISIVDRNRKLVNINGVNIICRISIKRDDKEKSTLTC